MNTEEYFKDLAQKTEPLRRSQPRSSVPAPPVKKPRLASTNSSYEIYKDKDYDYMRGAQDRLSKRMIPKSKMGDQVPSYKRGTRFVPKTGLAKLEKGEAVLTVNQAKKYRGSARILGSGAKKPTATQAKIRAAGHEMKVNPPKILKQTARKKGAAVAARQRVAIMLSKARAAGARIPEK